ncbi:MAG: hypothetical protein KGZ68_00890 [Dechloromonas sp.]|jgi:Mor family transcriptional regulator|nr:hypothetical protein [Dechloromonas sp.]
MGKTAGYELYEFLTAEIIQGVTKRFGDESRHMAEELASDVCDELVAEWGGMGLYLPRCTFVTMSVRNKKIFSEFTGQNYQELARSYGLSEMRIRNIVAIFRNKSRGGRTS